MDRRIVLSADNFISADELRQSIQLLADLLEGKIGLHLYCDGFNIVFDRDTGDVWMENDLGKTYGKAGEED